MRTQKQLLFLLVIILTGLCGCGRGIGIAGAGWDDDARVEEAKRYPTTRSDRISLTAQSVPPGTFSQQFDTVFDDFPHSGKPVQNSSTRIDGTPYSVSYKDFTLKVFKDEVMVAERKLPKVFYMHPMSSGVMKGGTGREDIILCRTHSRATTGLHYVCIMSGKGNILYEGVLRAGEDWDIAPGEGGTIIIGGANTKTVIALRD